MDYSVVINVKNHLTFYVSPGLLLLGYRFDLIS